MTHTDSVYFLRKRSNKRDHDNNGNDINMMAKPPPQTDFQNTFINDTMTSQRGPTLGDIQKPSPEERATSHLSLSSDEYKSSTNDIRLNVPHSNGGLHPPPNDTTPTSNGHLGPPVQPVVIVSNDEYATVNTKARDKERQSKSQKKRHDGDDTGDRSKRKHRKSREHSTDDRKNKKQRHHNRSYEEVGESSKSNGGASGDWDEQNDSKVNQSYDNVEYC